MLLGSNENRSSDALTGGDVGEAVLREATADEVGAWDEMVERFGNHRIFHKTCWLRYLEAVSGARALFLVYEKGGERVGCLPGLLLRKGGLRIFGSPLAGWQTESMGPAFDDSLISAAEISRPLAAFLRERYGVQHIEMTSAHLDAETLSAHRFRGREVSTYRVPLFPGDEARALSAVKPKTRNQLRKAIKLGLLARVETEETFVEEFYEQTKEVFTRRGKSVPFTKGRVVACFRHLKMGGNLLALSVRLPDERETCIATGLFMIEGRELHLWGWAHRTSYRWYCPMELLTWTAILKGMEAGCLTLDMAGGGDAKLKFGATPDRTLQQWLWSRYEVLAALRDGAEKLYRWQQSLRGRLARGVSSSGQEQQARPQVDEPGRTAAEGKSAPEFMGRAQAGLAERER
jgi:CelD/BcsL family acetyltransferase involved in cellulose biosynthesis